MRACILLALVALCLGEEPQCDGPPGQYCGKDLAGYWDCAPKKSTFVKCPESTRCSCYLDNKCTVDKANICAKFEEPLKMVNSFSVIYYGNTETHSRQGKSTTNIQGTIHQDTEGERFFKETYEGSKRSFTLILRDNGQFKKYEGTYPNHCSKTTVNSFQGFTYGIKFFTRTATEPTSDKDVTKETWFFQNGARHGGQSTQKWTWVVEANKETNTMTPKSYKKEFWGSNHAAYNKITKWTSIYITPEKPANDWYRVPTICQK